jgi:hypothetical protein
LLDIASKILSLTMVDRMQLVQKEFRLRCKTASRADAAHNVDALFSTVLGLQKRKEHGLATWVLFIDLMKAFDTIPTELLFKIGDVDTEVDSKIGVRQGSCEGPVLFIFIIQACLETLDWPVPKPTFCTRDGARGQLKGDAIRFGRKAMTIFELWASLFADDCATLFESRADMITGANCLYNHFLRFGLHIHIGRGGAASKTEAMYCPARGFKYEDGDTSNFDVAGGYIGFSDDFKYLGAIIDNSLTSESDIDKRIVNASAAFGALRPCIFAKKGVSRRVKGMIYSSLVITILLYGSVCWSVTEEGALHTAWHPLHRRLLRLAPPTLGQARGSDGLLAHTAQASHRLRGAQQAYRQTLHDLRADVGKDAQRL